MKLALTSCNRLELQSADPPTAGEGQILLRVLCCAVCRTDAKMFRDGHRDLVLPRVMGHEIVGVDESTGRLHVVWPGQNCGVCSYCQDGRENLCEEMRIIGFHDDGGFASHVLVPQQSCIPVEGILEPKLLSFAEPVACVLNGLSRVGRKTVGRAVIYGGGVMGMVAALILARQGWQVLVIERSQEKIARLAPLCEKTGISVVKDSVEADFDLAINCCDDPIAFSLAISKLRKGGTLSFFSGLKKNKELDSNLLNLIHYKELDVAGSYGPRRDHMAAAIPVIHALSTELEMLVDGVITLDQVETVLDRILSGEALKYIVDLQGDSGTHSSAELQFAPIIHHVDQELLLSPVLQEIIGKIKPLAREMLNRAEKKVDLKAKPLGALGRIESLAIQLSGIQNSLMPRVDCQRMLVFAGDHGVVEEGVSAYPSRVTRQMVKNFLNGGAAINVFCHQYAIDLTVVDMGVKGTLADHPLLSQQKVRQGTRNFALQRAMTRAEAIMALENGGRVFLEMNRKSPCTLLGLGEMGIGNSSSATAIIAAVCGLSIAEVVGRGTGVDDRGLARKREVLDRALALHQPDPQDGLNLLECLGGYELGGICGAVLAGAASGCCVVLDGLISTAAGLLAWLICPEVKEYLVAGHKSVEVGQGAALEKIGLVPVLDLDMRLGEGTGAAITMNLVDLSCRMMREMASFEEAGVDTSL